MTLESAIASLKATGHAEYPNGITEEDIAARAKFLALSPEDKMRHCVNCGEEFIPPICGHINCDGRGVEVYLYVERRASRT